MSLKMNEIQLAVDFIARLLLRTNPSADQLAAFKKTTAHHLERHYERCCWDMANPNRGNAYRAITTLGGRVHPALMAGIKAADLSKEDFCRCVPSDLVLWVDPNNVSYRFGDYGSICHLLEEGKVRSTGSMELMKQPGMKKLVIRDPKALSIKQSSTGKHAKAPIKSSKAFWPPLSASSASAIRVHSAMSSTKGSYAASAAARTATHKSVMIVH